MRKEMLLIRRNVRLFTDRSFIANRKMKTWTGLTSAKFMKSPQNEPILDYRKGSDERAALDECVAKLAAKPTDIPIIIGAEQIHSADRRHQIMPFDTSKVLANYSYADSGLIKRAIENCLDARNQWERLPLKERAEVMLRAADLCAGERRMELNAATMLGQAKTVVQAEIDAACELVDFLRFNALFALKLLHYQPISTAVSTNKLIYRGLEGFVAAVSPFNFTAIGGNLASCPALMGNVVVWKPSDTAMLSNYVIFQILRDAGLPAGVVNFVPADGPTFGDVVTSQPQLAGINFTGSVPTFRHLWKQVASNLDIYHTFPRLIGECGGKNFHFVHKSADMDSVAASTVRSAFEYQGQKCSACSRLYIPESAWPTVREKMLSIRQELKLGSPLDASTFVSAVIDERAFGRIQSFIADAEKSADCRLVAGGTTDNSKGFFVQPTIIETTNPQSKLMTEEIFGPVLTVYPYPDDKCDETLRSLKNATSYGLTGAVFSNDKQFLDGAREILRDAVGNLYLNDKCTGSVVGQQPFGGARLSGTNDKAGGPHYVLRWASPQTIKETSVPLHDWRYPSMD